MKILLVEDDQLIGGAIKDALHDHAYALDWVTDGCTALSTIQVQPYGLILLDLGLPSKDGFEVLRTLRQREQAVPVIIITARDSLSERIQGLDLGADDYLIKPFSINELLARMRAVTRRHHGVAKSVLSNGVIILDPVTREVLKDHCNIALSAREYALLHALLLRPGAILSRSELEDKIYGWNEEVESNAVEFLIYSLRKKLGKDAIKNIRGLGWMVSKEQ